MVKVKIINTEWEDLKRYVGNTYDAVKLEFDDGRVDYHVQVKKDMMAMFSQFDVEEIQDEPEASVSEHKTETVKPTNKILLVEDGSTDTDDLRQWCTTQNIKLIVYRSGSPKPEFMKY